jgi:dihydrolipoamide dehydrogenase
MYSLEVDIAIIGAGTAGLNAVREAEKSGKRWVLIESDHYGTTCARVGCMPSKLLIAAADTAHEIQRGQTFGLHIGSVEIDGKAVMTRLREERDYFVGGVVKDIEALPKQNRLRGLARFLKSTTLEITALQDTDDSPTRVQTTATVVATGSSPVVPPQFEAVRQRVFTTDNIFEIEDLPPSLAVIGTGLVGLELGQAFSRLGVEVTFFDRSQYPGSASDPKVCKYVLEILQRELNFNMSAEVLAADMSNDDIEIRWRAADGVTHSDIFAAVLVAAGRAPNLKSLNLAATGLSLDDKGQPQWNPATGQCGELPIFLAGDINGYRPLLHEAGDEGRISGANSKRWPVVETHQRRAGLSIAFSDPQIAIVGTPYSELNGDICIGEMLFENQGRARIMNTNRGIVRLYAQRGDCALVGAELFGPRVEHMAHLLAWAIQERTPVQHLLQAPVYHPTLEEGIRSALRDLAKNLAVENQCRTEDMSISPGM